MATNRGNDGPDRTIGLGSGSNGESAIFALTFTAIDTIVLHQVESIFHSSAASVYPFLKEGEFAATVRGGIHERGESREQVDAKIQLSNRHHHLWRGVAERMCDGREIRCGKGAQSE